jgi:hypothetical protein
MGGLRLPLGDPILGRKTKVTARLKWEPFQRVLVPIMMFPNSGGSELASDVDCASLHRLASLPAGTMKWQGYDI